MPQIILPLIFIIGQLTPNFKLTKLKRDLLNVKFGIICTCMLETAHAGVTSSYELIFISSYNIIFYRVSRPMSIHGEVEGKMSYQCFVLKAVNPS